MLRPRIYPKNHQERAAWLNLIKEVESIGILQYCQKTGVKQTITEFEDGLELELDGTTIQTKEQLIAACNIDTNKWEVNSFRISTWQQKENGAQLYAVKCKFKPKTGLNDADILQAIERGLKKAIRPQIQPIDNPCTNIAIINIFDAHIDKVTRAIETGEESDINKSVKEFKEAFFYLLSKAGTPEIIIFPVGNDFFNVNDNRNTTKKGTPQDSYMSFIDTFEIGLNLILDCIEDAAKIAKVHVPIIAGNHAEDLEYILGSVIATVFRNSKTITVDYSRKYRKYYSYNQNLFMFCHGDKVKNKIKEIPQIMATEEPQMWANSTHRYAIFGDIHHERTHELRGVTAMFLRSMSGADKWHHSEGYFSKKTAYLHIFSECAKFTRTETINF